MDTTLLAVTQTIGAFTSFLPRIQDVRKADPNNPNDVRDVRAGEAAGCVIALTIGAIGAHMSKSMTPLYAALVICAVEIALYESLLKDR